MGMLSPLGGIAPGTEPMTRASRGISKTRARRRIALLAPPETGEWLPGDALLQTKHCTWLQRGIRPKPSRVLTNRHIRAEMLGRRVKARGASCRTPDIDASSRSGGNIVPPWQRKPMRSSSKSVPRSLVSAIVVAAFVPSITMLAAGSAAAANGARPGSFTMRGHHAVVDVRKLPRAKTRIHERPEREAPRTRVSPPGTPAPVGSGVSSGPLTPAPSPSSSFDGLSYNGDCGGTQCGDGHPPDPNGDRGPAYYIPTINTSIGIYNKGTGAQVAAFTFNSLMSQGSFGNLCDTDNYGDPVVVYDTFHDRWIITDFAFRLDRHGNVISSLGSYQCFAVSASGDPVSGGWNFYSMHITDALQAYT